MAKKSNLPMEVHENFRKANMLHGYVETEMGEACQHALETGQELLAAKKSLPHGRWEDECKRLFNGSASSARFYMQFAKNMEALPKRQQSAVLLVEGSVEGAAKAAKAAAKPKPPKPDPETEPDEPIDVDSEPATPAEVQAAVESAAKDDDEAPLPDDPEQTIQEVVEEHNKAIESFCRELRKVAKEKPDLEWLDHKGRWEGYFRKITQGLDTLRSAKCVVCPSCNGEECKECDEHGYLPKIEAEGVK